MTAPAIGATPARPAEPRWPDGYAPGLTSVHTRNEALLHARVDAIWEVLVAAPAWPDYYRHSSHVVMPDAALRLGPGMRFRWRALGLPVDCTVVDFDPPTRISWFAFGFGVRAFHTWSLVAIGSDTCVRTDETQKGWGAWLGRPFIVPRLTAAHAEWLTGLERAAGRD